MGKSIAVASILFITFVSVVVFITQPQSAKRSKDLAGAGEPRVIVDEIAVTRYQENKQVASFSAKLAHFVDPNIIEAFASVRATRIRKGVEENLRCEAVHAQFTAESMSALLHKADSQVSYAEVEDQVVLGVRDEEIRTERAQYYADRDLVSSREPVHIDGPNRTFVGEEGFHYNLSTEVMELPGVVRGAVKPSVFEKK